MRFLLVFLFVIFHGCFSKQYRVNLLSMSDCTDPELPYMNPKPYDFNWDIYEVPGGAHLLRGNITLKTDVSVPDKRGSFSYGSVTPTGVKWKVTLNKLRADGFAAKAILGAYGIPLRGKVVKKGVYPFNGVDVDKMDSALVVGAPRILGKCVVKIVIVSKTETLGCWLANLIIEPLKKRKV